MNGLTIKSLKPESLTWDMACRLFWLRCKAQNISPRTQEHYGWTLALFQRFLAEEENLKPAEVTAHHLRAYLEACKAKNLASETVDSRFRHLRTFFRFLAKDGLVIRDPSVSVERLRVEHRLIRPFTQEQFLATLAQISAQDPLGLRDRAVILLLADSGLRVGEALSLKIGDLDLANNTAIVMGKGRKERRVCWGEVARKALLQWLKARPMVKDTDWVFCNRFGEQLRRTPFGHRFKQYTQRAGIAANRLSCHALRHFWACQFLKNSGDVVTLSRMLGHTTLAMSKRYLNLTDDEVLAKARQGGSVLDRMGMLPGERRQVRVR